MPESTEKKILEFRKNAGVSKDPARDANRNSGKRKHSYVRFGRIAGIAGLCLICVFAASMSSEANRKYLVNSVRILSGNDSQFITDNSSDNEHATTEESDAIADIEEKLGVKMPEFYYRPYGMEFLDCEINDKAYFAKLEYQYEENVEVFYIEKQKQETTSKIKSLNGTEVIVDEIVNGNLKIAIKELEDETDKEPTYVASWTLGECTYSWIGKMHLNELKKIVKEMKV